MRERRWLLLTLYGLLIGIAVSDAIKATRAKFKIATTSTTTTTTEEPAVAENADDEVEATTTSGSADGNATNGHTLTGIPQIDYIWDPNLPRELNGYNLSDYPFYASMPEDIDFKCDGLHDGFYASVPHKCQVYHHCLFGTRYDFLCANFTAFDQKTFICHFVSEVDCANSKKYWHRNDALYKAATTTTSSTTTTSTTTTSTITAPSAEKAERLPARERDLPPRRRRPPPRRPAYDYYDEDYYDDEYERARPRGYNRRDYDDYEDRKYRRDRDWDRDYRHRDFRDRERDTSRERYAARGNRRDPARSRDPIDEELPRPRLRDQDPSRTREIEDRVKDLDDRRHSDKKYRDDYDDKDSGSLSNNHNNEGLVKPAAPPSSVYARPRAPPKLRRPVPLSEQDKYAYSTSTTLRALIADEPRRRPSAADDSDEPRRRPAIVDDLEEPRRRPAADNLEDSRRRPAVIDDLEEPRRRPAADNLEESRRRPAIVDDLDEPRRRPASDNLEEPRRRPIIVDDLEEPRRRPAVDTLEDSRRRPAVDVDDDDYYEDEMEEVRPRWQTRGRPLRDRDFHDKRYRDRPFRPRYRDEDDDIRPRKHPERSRDRFYERDRERGLDRGRDRSLDRKKDRTIDRDRSATRTAETEKLDRSSIYSRPTPDRDRENERPRPPTRFKDSQEVIEPIKKPGTHDRSTTEIPVTTTTTEEPENETLSYHTEEPRDRSHKFTVSTVQPKLETQPTQQQQQQPQQQQQQQQQRQQSQQQNHQQQQLQKHTQLQYQKIQETTTDKELLQKYWKPTSPPEIVNSEKEELPLEEYSSEYYDDIEEPAIVPMPPPRPTVRVVKRPFLPSRGGIPNPRGLLPVGSKAQTSRREENPIKQYVKQQTSTASYLIEDDAKTVLQEDYQLNKSRNFDSNKQTYNAYKNVQQPELIKKPHQHITENFDIRVNRPISHRPESVVNKRRSETEESVVAQKSTSNWHNEYVVQEQNNEAINRGNEPPSRDNIRNQQNDNSNIYSSSYKTDEEQDPLVINGNFRAKQKINEVTHHNLQDIPESEYDVTLNEALTPNLSQEPNLPSGFVLPLHRQLGRDAILQPSENTYKFSRPINHQPQKQQKQTPQETTFLHNHQYPQTSAIARNNDRGKTVYFRTPETIQISGTQYRQQRGHWGDYTGF